MLHPLRYKLNKTWTLNYYSLPPFLPQPPLSSYLPPFLSPSLPLTPSSSDPPSFVSASHYIYPVFLILSHSSLLVYTPLPPRFRPPLFVFVPILSFSLRRTWIQSWLFAHIYTNVEAIYAIQSNCVIGRAMLHRHYRSLTRLGAVGGRRSIILHVGHSRTSVNVLVVIIELSRT